MVTDISIFVECLEFCNYTKVGFVQPWRLLVFIVIIKAVVERFPEEAILYKSSPRVFLLSR